MSGFSYSIYLKYLYKISNTIIADPNNAEYILYTIITEIYHLFLYLSKWKNTIQSQILCLFYLDLDFFLLSLSKTSYPEVSTFHVMVQSTQGSQLAI